MHRYSPTKILLLLLPAWFFASHLWAQQPFGEAGPFDALYFKHEVKANSIRVNSRDSLDQIPKSEY